MTQKATSFILGFALISVFSFSCDSARVVPPEFDGDRAFAILEKQVAFGPRVPGSEESAKCRDYFYRYFKDLDLVVDSQKFVFFDLYSQSNIDMVNVIASYKSNNTDNKPGIVLMAHYDSRPRTDYATTEKQYYKPIDGASDGASGVAVLMEIARLFTLMKPEVDIDIVLVDGEDWGKSGDHQFYMLGSKEFARQGIRGKYRFGIVVDLVGDKDLTIYREQFSEKHAKELNDIVFETARELNIRGFIDSVKYSIQDDHLSLITAGVPAVNIIDFDYEFWHTEFDTPDKCSPQSLESVGKVVTEIIYNKSLWQKIQ